jgi:serine/arginine repetitive matrix protein 2
MLGGGRVRRCSVTSMIGSSPCIQVERRKNIFTNPPETVFSRIKNAHPEDHESPEVSRVIETKPSIASTTNSFKFGDERMIRARHGLLERQSLENTALMGDGEDLSASGKCYLRRTMHGPHLLL